MQELNCMKIAKFIINNKDNQIEQINLLKKKNNYGLKINKIFLIIRKK